MPFAILSIRQRKEVLQRAMNITKFSKVGSYHKYLNQQNQDYLCSIETEDFAVIMLADGATGCKEGQEGAWLACDAVAEIIKRDGSGFFQYSEKKISYLLIEQILYWLETHIEEGEDILEYGSTFLLAFIEKENGRMVLVNLGDGAVLSVNPTGVEYRIQPKQFQGKPCLTVTDGADEAMQVKVENLAFGERVLLGSDGFLEQLSDSKEGNEIRKRLCGNDLKGVNKKLSEMENVDDCSYIVFTRERI